MVQWPAFTVLHAAIQAFVQAQLSLHCYGTVQPKTHKKAFENIPLLSHVKFNYWLF